MSLYSWEPAEGKGRQEVIGLSVEQLSAYAAKKNEGSWLTTELLLGVYGGNRMEFLRAQQLFFEEGLNLIEDLRYRLYLGSEEFSGQCLERSKGEQHDEKPQARSLLRTRDIRALVIKILNRLGEKDPESVLRVRKYRCQNRDIAIYVLYQLGVYLNKEIGMVFGVGYTAIPGAVKRGQEYLRSNGQLERLVNKTIDDI